MTDIQRQFKNILRFLRAEVQSETWVDNSSHHLREKFADLLPRGYGVGAGRLTNDAGELSEPVQIIVYDRALAKDSYSVESKIFSVDHALLVLDVARWHTITSFQDALERMASVKALKSFTEDLQPKKKKSQPPPGQRREKIPKSRLPVGMLFCEGLQDWGDGDEGFVQETSACLQAFPIEHQPDYIYFEQQQLTFRNVLLDSKPLTGYEIRFLRSKRMRDPNQCYVCKEKYFHQHFFYDYLCLPCGDLNYHKRHQSADLSNRIALVTGGRVKIGFQVALRLLRSGAQVIVTSRFPHDTAQRYAQVHDFDDWRDHLHIVGLDLRHTPSVEGFIDYLYTTYPYLDVLINNAAQTVRRPPAFYAHLIPFEQQPIAELPPKLGETLAPRPPNGYGEESALEKLMPSVAMQSQIPLVEGDEGLDDEALFPPNQVDRDGQQIDNRAFNSWVMQLDEVSMPEMVEVHLVNAVAPGLLAGGLRDLMVRSPNAKRYIVNVSSVEGLFSIDKQRGVHPHTNMAKAALNMLTYTIAEDFAGSNIFVNSIDPGWVSDQFPRSNDEDRATAINQLPIDIEDAAARVCDVIFSAENGETPQYGKFLKDYQVFDW